MNTQNNNQQTMTVHLSQSDIDTIYRKQKIGLPALANTKVLEVKE